MPFCIVPERVKVAEHCCKSVVAQPCDVLNEHITWLGFPDNPAHLSPQPALLTGESCHFPGAADVGAWESATNNVNWSIRVSMQFFYILANRHIRPVFAEYPTCHGVNLTECNGGHPCPFQPKRKSAYAAK
jgi:hypothetical protein